VVAHDHIGHGKSGAEGQRFCFFAEQGGWDMALTDMARLRAFIQELMPGLPYFMFGHSMGSFLLRSYLLTQQAAGLSGAIICGSGSISLLRLKLGGLLIKLERRRLGARGLSPLLHLGVMGNYNRQFRPVRTRADWLCSDAAVVDGYLADPFCRKLPTVGLYDDMCGALAAIGRANGMRLMESSLPLLLICGDKDPVGKNGRAVRRLYSQLKKAGCADISLRLYPGCRHMLLYEHNRREVYTDITDWLDEKIKKC
jgi:alpha-beta hydrolase superfamily lysophospholipase